MIKWEYHTEEVPDAELVSGILERRLNQMGDEGWELVSFSMDVSLGANSFAIFKRMMKGPPVAEKPVDVKALKEVFMSIIVEVVRDTLNTGEIDLKQYIKETPFRVGITGEGKEVSKEKMKIEPKPVAKKIHLPEVEIKKVDIEPKPSKVKPDVKPTLQKPSKRAKKAEPKLKLTEVRKEKVDNKEGKTKEK